MVNKSTFYQGTEPIKNILEIRLNKNMWFRVVCAAGSKKSTYSWVVRYAVFRLIKRRNLTEYLVGNGTTNVQQKFFRISNKVALEKNREVQYHRHRLCLYGDDELFIRLASASLGMTMTKLVRIALEFYLWRLNKKKRCFPCRTPFVDTVFFWLGIKSFARVDFVSGPPRERSFSFKPYKRKQYWNKSLF